MENIYEWLYDNYAEPQLSALPVFQDELLQPILRMVSETERIDLTDKLISLQLNWCTAAFQIGLQLGMRLS